MGLSEFIKSQFVDVIEYVEDTNTKTLIYKYTRYGDEIKQGAELIVRNGQCAVFVHKGVIADILAAGNYKLNTQNLPFLSSLKAIPYLFNSPIKSDLYFINTTQFIGIRWGTKGPIIMRDKDFNMVRISAYGSYSFRILNIRYFMEEIFGARKLSMTHDILSFLWSFVSESISMAISESNIPVLDLATNYRQLSGRLCEYVNDRAKKLGIVILDTVIDKITLPKEVEKMIDEQSGIGMASKNMNAFMQYQTARAMRDASNQQGGLAGLGVGFAVGNQFMNSISETKNSQGEKSDIEKVREYKALLDDGVITDEEFQNIKRKILGL